MTDIEKQEKLDKGAIKLKFIDEYTVGSLGDVLKYLFFNNGASRNTIRIYKTVPNRAQRTGLARSIEDAYLLAKYYLPDISYPAVKQAIQYFYKSFEHPVSKRFIYLSTWYCTTVRRQVHGANHNLSKEDVNKILDEANLNYYPKVEVDEN